MIFCPNCGKQNTSLLKSSEGELYQLDEDLNQMSADPKYRSSEKNIIRYTGSICNDCGNFFATGEKVSNEGI